MMLTGKMITSEEAAGIGLINKLVDKPSDLLPACKKMLLEIMKNAPLSIEKVITSANAIQGKEGYDVESSCFADLIKTIDSKEGLKAFMEKRPPKFKGE